MTKMLSLREIQLAELELLKCFSDFCKKYSLRYYLIGGTLLGAIRHKGFIPWDDDVDVCMPRPDYNRFLAMNVDGEFPDYVKRISYRDGNNAYAFAKLSDSRINIESIYSEDADVFLWIDVFPVDGLPDNHVRKAFHYKRIELLQTLLGLCYAKIGAGSTPFRRFTKRFFKPIVRLGKKYYWDCIEKQAQKYSFEETKAVGVVNGSLHGIKESMDRTAFLQVRSACFEQCEYPVFSCAHEYLQNIYGDYTVLPSMKNRKRHIVHAWIGEK